MNHADRFGDKTILLNKKARREFFIEKEFEAGMVLEGWEVKSLRAVRVNISDSYVMLTKNAAYLFGSTFQPLSVSSTHVKCDLSRTRKLLLHKREIDLLYGYSNRNSYTIVALSLYWKGPWCKLRIGLARGKKMYDKRMDAKKKEWKKTERKERSQD